MNGAAVHPPRPPQGGVPARIAAHMESSLLTNDDGGLGGALRTLVAGSTRVSVAVAFARQSGLREIEALERGGRAVQFLAGTDFQQTEVELLDRLSETPGCETRAFLGARLHGGATRTFHPKVYLGEREDGQAMAIVGSANFTRGGLRQNHEAAVLLRGDRGEAPLVEIRAYIERLWADPFSVRVTPELRARYGRLREAWTGTMSAVFEGADYQTALDDYKRAIGDVVVRPEMAVDHQCWLLVSNPVNADIVRRRGVWGNKNSGPIGRMRPGDPVVLYVKGESRVAAWGLVGGPPYEDQQPLWPDGIYPYRVPLSFLGAPQVSVSMRLLAPRLSFIRSGAGASWGTYLQTSQRTIPWIDFAVLRDAIDGARLPSSN